MKVYLLLPTVLLLSSFLVLKGLSGAQAANNTAEPGSLTSCQQDADCIVVPYSHCCGSTKRAINKATLSDYNTHPEWQKFDNVAQCAVMGACIPDNNVTQAHCGNGLCQLIYPTEK